MIQDIILPFLVSVLGLLLGYALTFIAAEEIRPGEKYFRWLQRVVLVVFAGMAGYWLFIQQKTVLVVVLLLLGLLVLAAHFPKVKTILKIPPGRLATGDSFTVLGTYLFFALAYFVSSGVLAADQRLLLAALIFLYGLPAGTMMRKR